MENKIGRYDFVAEPFHVDFTGRLFMGVLGNHLLNCAGFHASDRGFGIATLNESNYTWVLSRLAVELEDMPKAYDTFSIETWVENVYRLFTDRNFAIIGSDGKACGYARSVWAMIDLNSRKPADLLELHGGRITDYILTGKECPIDKPGRIKVSVPEPMHTIETRYGDIDINGHVNSIKYIEHILDLFPKDWYARYHLARFEMAYVAESYYGDTLSFFCESKENNNGEYDIEVRKNVGCENKPNGDTVCRSKLLFRNK
ncbi:MAG: thioesterase [Clostridium sp.]|nr:thioesterase [Clostridium sp.]